MDEVEQLTAIEMLALAALLRMLIRDDGKFSIEERAALAEVAASVGQVEEKELPAESYRTTGEPQEPIGAERLYELLERTGKELPDEESIRALARKVTRPAARATIHALLFEVAASDIISAGESAVLDWLSESWGLAAPQDLEGDDTAES